MNKAKAIKILLLGVGNSGTKLLGKLIHELICQQGDYPYHYEPLYWEGRNGEEGIKLNQQGIKEHKRFPLLPEENTKEWPWMDKFLKDLNGLAKFIRAGSRIQCIKSNDVKIIWITRELYSFLGSMQQNFPRESLADGWHHRPGQYDDFDRLQQIYTHIDFSQREADRIELEAVWWHIHNMQCYLHKDKKDILHVRYEDLCQRPEKVLTEVAEHIEFPMTTLASMASIFPAKSRKPVLSSRHRENISLIAGELNQKLYQGSAAR